VRGIFRGWEQSQVFDCISCYHVCMMVGEAIQHLLRSRNLTVAMFACATGMSRAQIYKLLQDKHSPNLNTIERMGRALDLSVAEFMTVLETIERSAPYS